MINFLKNTKTMNRLINEEISVGSSAIVTVCYSYDSKTLLISFISGLQYEYKDVPADIYLSFKYSDSLGKYFNKVIKHKYDFNII